MNNILSTRTLVVKHIGKEIDPKLFLYVAFVVVVGVIDEIVVAACGKR